MHAYCVSLDLRGGRGKWLSGGHGCGSCCCCQGRGQGRGEFATKMERCRHHFLASCSCRQDSIQCIGIVRRLSCLGQTRGQRFKQRHVSVQVMDNYGGGLKVSQIGETTLSIRLSGKLVHSYSFFSFRMSVICSSIVHDVGWVPGPGGINIYSE